ncbi:TIGR03083 family protein [Amycolatopsis arida]|uniref:TIGR03083 family protein n=1 Tax=Amycolatopsis arida TaxID=587909 RepID=A0A1I5XMZ0_9PSEU|nr:maleylpyruvate isomerase family mycothiol-dependent enzyme [Amycolatopsis arida]TDX97359.1 uncharacterized protein (TIGR03083 family) [Amycolatopsis arida]SFQ33176.1 TIGR03083 family protein [Amycolatopsis arida]
MTTSIPKQPLVSVLDEQWTALADLMAELPEPAWSTPTDLPGWSVRDVFAHVLGTEAVLDGEPTPDPGVDVAALPHVHNPIGEANERWVRALRQQPPSQVLARFAEVTDRRRAALAAMSQEEFDGPSWTPAGQATYGRFMQIRVFDCWMHEQDIRAATRRPGGDDATRAEVALDEIDRALGYIVGKLAGAPRGSSVTFALTGPRPRDRHVLVDGRAAVVPELPAPATTTLRLPAVLFARLAGGRVRSDTHRDEIAVTGDTALAERVLANLAYTL